MSHYVWWARSFKESAVYILFVHFRQSLNRLHCHIWRGRLQYDTDHFQVTLILGATYAYSISCPEYRCDIYRNYSTHVSLFVASLCFCHCFYLPGIIGYIAGQVAYMCRWRILIMNIYLGFLPSSMYKYIYIYISYFVFPIICTLFGIMSIIMSLNLNTKIVSISVLVPYPYIHIANVINIYIYAYIYIYIYHCFYLIKLLSICFIIRFHWLKFSDVAWSNKGRISSISVEVMACRLGDKFHREN